MVRARVLTRARLDLLTARAAHIDSDLLDFGPAVGKLDFQRHDIGAGEPGCRVIERDEARQLEREALLVIGCLAARDQHLELGGRSITEFALATTLCARPCFRSAASLPSNYTAG